MHQFAQVSFAVAICSLAGFVGLLLIMSRYSRLLGLIVMVFSSVSLVAAVYCATFTDEPHLPLWAPTFTLLWGTIFTLVPRWPTDIEKRILGCLSVGGTSTVSRLASELNATPEETADALEMLVAKGRVSKGAEAGPDTPYTHRGA